jgi:hypothetical protein
MYSTQCDIWRKFKKSINENFITGKLFSIILNVKNLIIGNTPICIKALLPYALLATSNPGPLN